MAETRPAVRNPEDDILVVGARARPMRDVYHALLRASWPATIAWIVVVFLGANALFAAVFVATGGIAHARPGSFADAFFFSVQTMATIGYGAMYPESALVNALVVVEAVLGLLVTAISTGLVFAKFSRPTSRVVFALRAAISPMNGVPTLAFRVANDRRSTIVEATIRVAATFTERTTEGVVFYRMRDLKLSRDRSPLLSRSWTVLHPIDDESPLAGRTPEDCARDELELVVTLVGTDDTSLQPVLARHRYVVDEIVWGARPADVLSELADGRLRLDVRRFDELSPSEPTAEFPYRWDPASARE